MVYISPPTVNFTEMPPPGDLPISVFSEDQMKAAHDLTKAIGDVPDEYDPAWRAILGSRMDDLLLHCDNLKSTVLAFRITWHSVNEKNIES